MLRRQSCTLLAHAVIVTLLAQVRLVQGNLGGYSIQQPYGTSAIPSSPQGASSEKQASGTIHSLLCIFKQDGAPNPPLLSKLFQSSDSASISALLLGNGNFPLFQIPNVPSNEHAREVVGLLSDVVVVVIAGSSKNTTSEYLQHTSEQLLRIAKDKQARGLTKGRLVIVSEEAADSWWAENLVNGPLKHVTPSLWTSFEVVPPQQLSLYTIASLASTVKHLLPHENNAFAVERLLREVYRISSGESVKDGENFAIQTLPPLAESREEPKPPPLEIPDDSPSATTRVDPQDRIQQVLTRAQTNLADLQAEMQMVQLESQTANRLPLLDFGDRANDILSKASLELTYLPPSIKTGLLSRLALEVQQLFHDQLQSLRDYYGRRYEVCLEDEEDESIWATEAEYATEGYRAAAEHAIPKICKEGGELSGMASFHIMKELQGLVQDMLEATQRHKDEQSLAYDDEDLEELLTSRPRCPRWVKKVASRALALGVNYLQGWLAWQGVKRAALERDREMPKFPLF